MVAVEKGAKAAWPYVKVAGKKAIPYVRLAARYLQDAENRSKLNDALMEARAFIKDRGLSDIYQQTMSKVKESGSSQHERKIAKALVDRMDAPKADLDAISEQLLLVKTAAVKPLCGRLESERAPVRKKAAWLLGDIADLDGLLPLVEASGDTDPDVHEQIEDAIKKILKAHAAPP
ncbi:MAG: hypothetical protein KKB90_07265 [Actinobacteria bacterium]|nr:hypothetical protein [Actinomycetota bacterium]MCG2819939.1 hypothetical protein [Actinomycetes bacterium]MBU4218749.1 hypothetical protein [Actinomycetota bacterium]MBU4359522.1 hypothetical protein [Actinomycetota bacterium]MBU4393190.1 hypothetical protein [Actinomycetota bacterium]